MPPFEERTFEVTGTLWDYGKIADVSASIAQEFLERIGDMSDLERFAFSQRFKRGILDVSGGIDRSIDLIGRGSLFDVIYNESMDPYFFNEDGDIVDYEGNVVPDGFELDNYPSLSFMQRAYRDKFIKDTPIPKMQAEDVMRFVEEACKKHPGISPLIRLDDVPEMIQQSLQHSIISSIQFDENLYGNGKGLVTVRFLKYEAV